MEGLSRKIRRRLSAGLFFPAQRRAGDALPARMELNLIIRIDGKNRRGARPRDGLFLLRDRKGPLRLITGGLVEICFPPKRPGRRPPLDGVRDPGGREEDPDDPLHEGQQEAETALANRTFRIERPYKLALAEIDRGRGVEAVRDLIRQRRERSLRCGGRRA